jgi:hypothetical protein
VAVLVAAIVAGAVLWLARPDDGPVRPVAAGTPTPSPAAPGQLSSPPPTTSSPSAATPSPRAACTTVAHSFDPRNISVPGVVRAAAVVTPPREADGVPGTPPLTGTGKTLFAFDREQGIRPGDPAGNVLLNAHTWPDGTALGNRLLAHLQPGDRIVVTGANTRLCYRVTERVEVLASKGLARYYDTSGPPQLAIVVCSGRRLGPGEWDKRTVWFAAPSV